MYLPTGFRLLLQYVLDWSIGLGVMGDYVYRSTDLHERPIFTT